jgi:hypothetical protein
VKGLRIEAHGEFHDLTFVNGYRTELMNGSGQIVLKVTRSRWSFECYCRSLVDVCPTMRALMFRRRDIRSSLTIEL